MTGANTPAFHVYRYRLRPMRPEQEALALQSLGNARWVYNQVVALNRHLQRLGERPTSAIEGIDLLPAWKRDHDWLQLGPSQTLQQALLDYAQAQTSHRQDPGQFKAPVFKKRADQGSSVRFPQPKAADWNARKGWINLPKLGQLRYFKDPRIPHGTIKQVSLVREGARWLVCLCVEQSSASRQNLKRHVLPEDPCNLTDADIVGIDMGHVHAATDHLGTHHAFPLEKVTQLDQKIAHIQAIVAHKKEAGKALHKHHNPKIKGSASKGKNLNTKQKSSMPILDRPIDSKRMKPARSCLRKLQTRRMDLLNDARHQLSHRLTEQAPVVCVEDLKLKRLLENAKREPEAIEGALPAVAARFKAAAPKPMPRVQEKSLHRGWACLGAGIILNQLEYKAARKGGLVIKVNPAYTSQTCPQCNHIAKNNRESQAVFRCKSCHFESHADKVGAINVRTRGTEILMASGYPLPKPPKHRRPRDPRKKKALLAQAS